MSGSFISREVARRRNWRSSAEENERQKKVLSVPARNCDEEQTRDTENAPETIESSFPFGVLEKTRSAKLSVIPRMPVESLRCYPRASVSSEPCGLHAALSESTYAKPFEVALLGVFALWTPTCVAMRYKILAQERKGV